MTDDILGLMWDEWNEEHILKHGLSRTTVEFVCANEPLKYKESYKNRILVVGADQNGRLVTVVLGAVTSDTRGVYYPFNARPSDRKERTFYVNARRRRKASASTDS